MKAAQVFQIHYLSDLDVSCWTKITFQIYAYLDKENYQLYLFNLKNGHVIW